MSKFHKCDNPQCNSLTDALHIQPNPIYKVVIGGPAAEQLEQSLQETWNISFDTLDALSFRVSPIVFYTRLDERTAIELAQEPGVDVTRARADWSI